MPDTIEPNPTVAAARITCAISVRDHAHAAVSAALDVVADAVADGSDPTPDEADAVVLAAVDFIRAAADLTREVCDGVACHGAGGLDEVIAAIATGIDDVVWITPLARAPGVDPDVRERFRETLHDAAVLIDGARLCLHSAGLDEAETVSSFMRFAEAHMAPAAARPTRAARPMAEA